VHAGHAAPLEPKLGEVLASAWGDLVRGAADRRHGFHVPVVASIGLDGAPSARTVVLRRVLPEPCELHFHTDLRGPKVAELARDPRVSWTFYDAGRKLQLRVAAVAEVHATGARADEAWARSAPSSRRCYLALAAPGARCDAVSPNLPEALRMRVPTVEESLAGRVNFALVATRVTAIDWLHLASEGHERARFQRGDDGLWSGCWCEP